MKYLPIVLVALTAVACASRQHSDEKPKKHLHQKVTADDQMKGSQSDIEITRKIRSRLTDDRSLSLSAQNITIVTMKKRVTLTGKVRDREEKDRVLSHARHINGQRIINNELTYTE